MSSLEVMIKQQEKKPKFKEMPTTISEKVSRVEIYLMVCNVSKDFDNLYVNMVKAGEAEVYWI